MTTLPTPHPSALAHSEILADCIRQEMTGAGGYISFARYMQLALYAPGLGYYSAGTHKFGKGGDFVTAPDISPLFTKCVAKQCQQILTALGHGDILEFGAGGGQFAADILIELEARQCLPENYFILEISADLRERQRAQITALCPHLLSRVHWLDTLPPAGMNGIIFANEVLDAMPVHCFRIEEDSLKERCVTWEHHQFAWCSKPPTTGELTQRVDTILQEQVLPNGYESEVNLMLSAWVKTTAQALHKGAILLIDYGYGRREFYHPDRSQGTLMCFYQHRRHCDPFLWVGLQDITAHVDFTVVAESAIDAGLTLAGYTTQAGFLLACGILDIAQQSTLSTVEQYQQNQAIKTLTLPSQMGEIVKVIGLTKQLDIPLEGFSLHNRLCDL